MLDDEGEAGRHGSGEDRPVQVACVVGGEDACIFRQAFQAFDPEGDAGQPEGDLSCPVGRPAAPSLAWEGYNYEGRRQDE